MRKNDFKPTHEIIDDHGESRGLYLKQRDHWISESVWEIGGTPLTEDECKRWGYSAVPLNGGGK